MDQQLKEKIKELSKKETGENENSVKYKFIIPFLECFGYSDMDFEHSSQGNRIDIYIGKRSSCGIVVEAKSYDKNLDDYLSQLKRYSDDKRPLLAIISNGEEIRFYSPFWRGVPNFSETILYSIKRVDDLNNDEIIERLEKIVSKGNLDAGRLDDYIQERENEIKNAKKEVEALEQNYKNQEEEILNEIKILEDKINEIKTQISEKNTKILDLKNNKEECIEKLKEKYRLPIIEKRIIQPSLATGVEREEKITSQDQPTTESGNQIVYASKKKKVNLSQLVQYNKVKEGDKLFFYDRIRRKIYKDEYAFVEGDKDKLRYWRDNRFYSPSDLAKTLRKKVGLTREEQETQGPIFWITEKGKTLDKLNDEVREILDGQE